MKTLLILRHAKSSKDDPTIADHDRPLNERGRRDAPRVGAMLKERNLVPDQILSSPAQRAKDTAEAAARACGFSKPVRFIPEFYPGTPEDFIDILNSLSDDAATVMVVGHNPAIEELVWVLVGAPQDIPTASLTYLKLDITAWQELTSKTETELQWIWKPKENL